MGWHEKTRHHPSEEGAQHDQRQSVRHFCMTFSFSNIFVRCRKGSFAMQNTRAASIAWQSAPNLP
ncbi:hypothetical protein [Dongia sp.]|uniref:hypothetical protein n=1 Tax=Dongia sp. TaxID=1977262 RepID=UPI0035B14A0E